MHIASVPVPSHSRLRRIVIGLLVLVLGLAFMGMTYENIFEARDRRFNPTEGQLVDVGGKNNEFILELWVAARKFGDHIVRLEWLRLHSSLASERDQKRESRQWLAVLG